MLLSFFLLFGMGTGEAPWELPPAVDPGQENQAVTTRPAETTPFERTGPAQQSAKVVMDDGTAPPVDLQVVGTGRCVIRQVFGNGTVMFGAPGPPPNGSIDTPSRGVSEEPLRANTGTVTSGPLQMPAVGARPAAGGCTALVRALGARSQNVRLADRAVIVLKRLGENEGSSISMTVLKAPPAAKKAYAKGAEAFQQKKYAEARKQFEQATKIYPDYALAWSELGRVLALLGEPDAARAALKEAIRIDKMYIKPLVQLAGLEADLEHWPECAQAADAAIQLKPIEFPGAYYYRALAYLRAGDWENAVKLSREATQVDMQMEYTRAYVVLASALEKKGDRIGAAAALRHFLATQPSEKEADWAQTYLKKLEARP
jgi:Tfp pilus assembly protein PilF